MIIEFEQNWLRELYEEGKTSNRKYRFQPTVIKQYRKTIDRLKPFDKIEQLYFVRSLNYEKLTGNKKGLESIRVNDQYRIEFISRTENVEHCMITICSIVDLSNHYD